MNDSAKQVVDLYHDFIFRCNQQLQQEVVDVTTGEDASSAGEMELFVDGDRSSFVMDLL